MGPGSFATIVGRSDLPLDEAALAISAEIQAPLDEVEWLAALDQLAADCATPTPDGIARHLAESGFEGNRSAYYSWRNSCLDHVLATRTGIPITLSIVMIEVGRRLGVPLVGVGMPSHFIVGVPGGGPGCDAFFDPFNASGRLSADDVRALFTEMIGERVEWDDGFLAPTPPRDVVARMLNNLQAIFTARSDPLRLALVMRLRHEMPELRARDRGSFDAALAVLN